MPCSSEGYPDNRLDDCSRELNEATRAACDLRTILRRGGTEEDLCAETRRWIAKHDDWDHRRIKEEERRGERQRVKQNALAKLTMDERRVLGL
jgi:hypothetical protein